MMIHRRVFDALDPPYFRSRIAPGSMIREHWREESDFNDPIPVGEDWDFCERACNAGFRIYLDTTIMLPSDGLDAEPGL